MSAKWKEDSRVREFKYWRKKRGRSGEKNENYDNEGKEKKEKGQEEKVRIKKHKRAR